ncbi:hypothetical protein [Komagataeibacter xylinus]|uniref:hypothetical protein n=1 Tax=Komagataeibacter xylinus TaxID=28448 RepID=UPI0011B7D633|nr:hypothetical protein [Komagataeibacter xylinus]GBQ80766.1 hypothetical protein AA15237_3066 [Komagataeibacter xylinus NBRC 15237]
MSEKVGQSGTFEIRLCSKEDATEPNWGATGHDFRLWRAKEALAQVEKRLSSQTTTLSAYETRTSSLLGWLSAEALATVGAVISRTGGLDASHWETTKIWMLGSVGFILPMVISAIYLSRVFKKKVWTVVGADAEWLMQDWDNPSEVECIESIVSVYLDGVQENETVLDYSMKKLQRGRAWFLLTPVLGAIWSAIVISWTLHR